MIKSAAKISPEGAAASVATGVSPERRAELEKWREAKRSLVFSSDVDGAYIDLYQAAREQMTQDPSSVAARPTILKLRLKDSTDEAYHRAELHRILRDGGTLILDLRGADPKLIKEWNSLYDFDAAGKGVQEVSDKLVIIALADKDAEAPPESVTSRSAKFYDQSKEIQADPLVALHADVAPDEAAKINLHHDADPKTWRYELLGSSKRDGALIKAMKEGLALEIQNAPLDPNSRGGAYDPELANLLRQVTVEKRIMNNGQWVYASENFKLALTAVEVRAPKDVRLQGENETQHKETAAGRLSTFYVNRHTVGMLFSRTVINSSSGKLARKTGLFDIVPQSDKAAPIKFVITEDLPLGKWNKLLSHPVFHDKTRAKPIIGVRAGVSIPKKFRELQSDTSKAESGPRTKTTDAPKATALGEVSKAIATDSKVLLVPGDLDLVHAELKAALKGKRPTYLQITPYRSDEELWESVQVKQVEATKKIVPEISEALKKLQRTDGVVVLSGIDSRSDLFKEQPGLLTPEPYLLVHGKVVAITGKLILVERSAQGQSEAKPLSHDLIKSHLTKNRKLLGKLQEFEQALASIPPQLGAVDKELYPNAPRTNLNKLKLFLAEYKQQQDWAKAADLVFGGDYGLHPEARAFIRVQARRIFDANTTDTPTISAKVVGAVQNSSGELAESSSHMWRLLDSLNGAALAKLTVSEKFTAVLNAHADAWSEIKRSLYVSSKGEFKEMYRQRFNLPKRIAAKNCIPLTRDTDPTTSPWTQMRDTAINLLTRDGTRPQVIFLQGAPGRGKSHLIRDIRNELKESRAMFGPITANPDMVFKSEDLDKLLKDWRGSKGGILLLDEGNLLPKHFWDRLREDLLADPTKSVVFSGNETFQSGRQSIALADELGVTLFFEQFSQEEKRSMIEQYTKDIPDSPQIAELILELTNFLENNQFGKSFTPRDLQEVSDWARFFGSSQKEVITHIWRVYSPAFTREQQESLRVFIDLRYGFSPIKASKEVRLEFNNTYSETMKQSGFVLRDESLGVATELAHIVELSRKRGEQERPEGGKRGVIIEAESGWGKDFTAVKTLEALGFTRGNLADDPIPDTPHSDIPHSDISHSDIPHSGAKRYYAINAELDFTTLQKTIERAAREGAVLIIREANALDAGILEAQVNDILTGNVRGVHPAFLTVMTVNSADVESMSAFSSALLSRVHHIKARPHSRETLEAMVAIAEPNLDKATIAKITGLHLYLRDAVGEGGRRPNTRDLLRAAHEAMKGGDHWRLSVVDSYLFYIENGLKGKDAVADSLRFLAKDASEYVPRSDVVPARIMKALAQVGLPSYIGDINFVIDPGCATMGADGYFKAKTGTEKAHTIAISPQAIKLGRWSEVILHEVRHALNDCGEGGSSQYGDLEQDIRDLRNQASFAHVVPQSGLMELTGEEQRLLTSLQAGKAHLKSERDFRLLMAVIAKTDDETLSKASFDAMFLEDKSSVVSVARKHFERIREISTCFAKRSFGGEFPSRADLHAKQVRLNKIVAEIFEDFQTLPKEERRRQNLFGGGSFSGFGGEGFGGGGWGDGFGGLSDFFGSDGDDSGSEYGDYSSGRLGSPIQDDYDPQQTLRDLEKSFELPPGSLSGPEGVTHDSGESSSFASSNNNILALEDPASRPEILKAPELNEEEKRILLEAQKRALQADPTPWQCPKGLWEEVVSEWSETSVSNGRRSDPSGSLQIDELFNGVRLEDARVSPGADVDKERKVIRIVGQNSRLTPAELGLFQELFALGFTAAIGDREPVASCVGLCIQEQQQAGTPLQKSEIEKRLSPAEQRRSEVLSVEELTRHLEAVATYGAIAKGLELLERKSAGEHTSLANKIVWPTLYDAKNTNEQVLHYLEDNESWMSRLRELTTDSVKSDEQTEVEHYMKRLELALDQDAEPDTDNAPETEEEMAQMAIDSYSFDPTTGVSTFARPKGVSDVALMRALNEYFRKNFPDYDRAAVNNNDLKWYEKLPDEHSDYCQKRDYSKSSKITITAVVEDTTMKDRSPQSEVLQAKSLNFSDPRDIALVAAIHACKNNGEDLFKGKYVRGSVPGFALFTKVIFGVYVYEYFDGYGSADVGASGSPLSPESR